MNSLRCAAYARFSSDRQSPSSITDQIRKCREFAERQGWCLDDQHIYMDEAVSGATDDRAGLRQLLAAATARPRPFDVVLIDDTSRLSRQLIDALRITEELLFAEVRLVFVSQGIDSDSEQAEMLLATHGMVDSSYIRELAKKTYRGMEGRALERMHTGGRCFGYCNQPIEDASKTDSYGRPVIIGVRLVVDEAEAETVQRIFSLYADGSSLKRIAKLLNAESIVSPRPQTSKISRSWCPSSIRKILSNDRYRGLVFWGKTRKVRSPRSGKRVQRDRPPTEWVKVEMPEQRIVSDELWERVQQRRQQVKELYSNAGHRPCLLRGRTDSSRYLFSGLLKCGICGASLTIVTGRGRARRAGYYGCPVHTQRGVCSNSLRIRRDVLEGRLLERLQAEILQPKVVKYTLARFETELLKALDNLDGELEQLRRRKAQLEGKISNLTRALADRYSPALTAELAEYEREVQQITEQLLGTRRGSVQVRLKDLRGFVLSRLADLRTLLNSDAVAARTELAKHVKAITLHPRGRSYRVEGRWDLLGDGQLVQAGPLAVAVLAHAHACAAILLPHVHKQPHRTQHRKVRAEINQRIDAQALARQQRLDGAADDVVVAVLGGAPRQRPGAALALLHQRPLDAPPLLHQRRVEKRAQRALGAGADLNRRAHFSPGSCRHHAPFGGLPPAGWPDASGNCFST